MPSDDNVNLGFEVEVVTGDAFTYPADVLAVKDAARSGGLDAQIRKQLKKAGRINTDTRLNVGDYLLLSGEGITQTWQILIVGSESIFTLHYVQLRELGRRFIEALWEAGADVKHLMTTVHGVQTGLALDEVEAFRALLLGMADATQEGHYPPALQRITFIERSAKRADLLRDALHRFLPQEKHTQPRRREASAEMAAPAAIMMTGPESFEPQFREPEATDTTPHVFVAMPFKDDYDDQFYLAIQPTVKGLGLLCERLDLEVFTGDIIQRMFERIKSARIVVALLDGANPNVYLEVGYALCAETPVVLLAHRDQALPFDVRTQRVLIYDKIYLLKQMLEEELRRLMQGEK